MLLTVEKTIASFLTLPGIFILLWFIVTLYLFRIRQSRFIKYLSLITLILMYIMASAFGTVVLLKPLELMKQAVIIEGNYPIVVLGGGINYLTNKKADLKPPTLQRLVNGYQLFRKYGGPLIFTGGVAIGHHQISEAEVAANWLKDMGVARDEIIIEDRARTTFENALYTKEILEKYHYKRVYLVTSAVHLLRATKVFKKQGIDVIPIPAGYLSSHSLGWLDYLPNRSAFSSNMAAVHEWLGLIWYRVTGRI
ncbi:YdcF family protein [Halocella sp. SP3-1]|uniref:YdcF family protein n=1 Tax=Halocella sp. SP3-1 TaxID=2382161 RepID=UPI000F75E4B4|nr:YdcF family protein [Halocella sp. SP3-1]AZO93334.1 YdcF family protein [Halocella sp. SP3-1]